MTRFLVRALAAVIALAVVFVGIAWLSVRASLPDIDGEIRLGAFTSPASIARDEYGIPVISAATRDELAYATGFAHAQDRFFQMDLIRRQAAGELSEMFGDVAIERDKYYRLHRFRNLAKRVLANASEADRRIIDNYAAGVNAGLGSLGARPFEYLVLRKQPEPWSAEDSLLVVYAMFVQLNDSRAGKDVRRGYAKRALPPDVYAWMYQDGTSWDAPIMGEARRPLPYPTADIFSIRDRDSAAPPAAERGRPPLNGSNNWVVGGALTGDGRALVSNDMHLGLSVPNIYYQARLVQTGNNPRDVTGVTLPGAPFVVAGSNGRVAWGYTNSYGDWSDAVVLKSGSTANTYKTADGDMPFIVHKEIILVDGGESVIYPVRETIWGPVDDRAWYPDGEIAISWIAHMPNAVNLNIMQLETVETVEDAIGVANTIGMPPQNFVVGDADGSIGWTIGGQIPIRTDHDSMVPADWSEQVGWTGWRSPDEYPRVINPPGHRIWTANARVADAEALRIIGDGGYDIGARANQIRDGLRAKDTFSPADMLAIQFDDRALFLGRWRDVLLQVLSDENVANDADLREYRRLVQEWVPRAVPESTGYRLVRSFRLEVKSRIFHALIGPAADQYAVPVNFLVSNQFEAPVWQLLEERPLHLLAANYENWDALLLSAVRENIRWFKSKYDTPLAERTWGEYNTARIRHPLSRALPALSGWLDMPRNPLNGDSNVPKAQGPEFGASERFSVSPGNEENSLMHMPGGQSGHPMSPFYRKGHEQWLRGEPSPFLPGEALHTLTLLPLDGTLGDWEH
ncbi:MAG: penicillin acylase family protein [Woeseiaceae bacterium]|nr:penicillin acylase family protein [Woeseiaceae bacterium]